MSAKAKKIELYLYNGTLNGMTYVSESDGWDLGGILYSCPRESTDILLNDDSCDKYGVYLLLSWNQRFKYIKDIYADEYFKVFKKKVKLQKTDLDNVRTNFLLNPNDPTNQYRSIYYKYICAVAFEISNFTDVAFKDFAKSIQNNLSPNAIISLAKI